MYIEAIGLGLAVTICSPFKYGPCGPLNGVPLSLACPIELLPGVINLVIMDFIAPLKFTYGRRRLNFADRICYIGTHYLISRGILMTGMIQTASITYAWALLFWMGGFWIWKQRRNRGSL